MKADGVNTMNKKYLKQIKGPAEIEILKGKVEIIGYPHERGYRLSIPPGKSIPLALDSEDQIRCETENEENITNLKSFTIPQTWLEIVKRIKEQKLRKILVLGEMDTGKSFFCTYLANSLLYSGLEPGILDCDLGQSDIGPPGTLGFLKVVRPLTFINESDPTLLGFIGAHSAGLHMLKVITSFHGLVTKAMKMCSTLIVNTSGWVNESGRALKWAKIEFMDPDLTVFLQRENELEHLYKMVPEEKAFKLHVKIKKGLIATKAERKNLRETASKAYFKDSGEKSFSFSEFTAVGAFLGSGTFRSDLERRPEIVHAEILPSFEGAYIVVKKDTDPETIQKIKKEFRTTKVIEEGYEKGTLIGLANSQNVCSALGIIKKIDWNAKVLHCVTPLKSSEPIKFVHFGSLKYNFAGEEAGFLAPGSI